MGARRIAVNDEIVPPIQEVSFALRFWGQHLNCTVIDFDASIASLKSVMTQSSDLILLPESVYALVPWAP